MHDLHMGNRLLCREEELTRAVLLEFLKSQEEIEEVQTMAGSSDVGRGNRLFLTLPPAYRY